MMLVSDFRNIAHFRQQINIPKTDLFGKQLSQMLPH